MTNTATMSLAGRVPMLWPREWVKPKALDLLAGTPIDCLLLGADAPSTLLERAKSAGLATVARLGPDTAVPHAGFTAALSATAISKEPWTSTSPVLLLEGGVWPRVKRSRTGNNTVEAGPTGLPWVDFNGWMVEIAWACAPEKAVWLEYAFPAQLGLVSADAYALAAADAEAAGARWVIDIDPEMRRGLSSRRESAMREWQVLTAALRFFQSHREWRSWRRKGHLAVLSDFAGPNEMFSGELLNLLARRGVPMLAIDKRRSGAVQWSSLRAVFYADQQPPAPPLKSALENFARQGGLAIAGHLFPRPATAPEPPEPYPAYDIFRLGKGRVAISREELFDPWQAAGDARLLLSRRHDPVRFWNAGATNFYYAGSPDGSRDLLQIVCYASTRRQTPLTAGVCGGYRKARLWRFAREGAEPLSIRNAPGGWSEIDVPDINTYAAIELER